MAVNISCYGIFRR